MSKEIQGHLNGHNLKLAVIVSRFNEFITSKLLDGAKSSLKLNGVKDEHITIVKVPGAFELPLIAKTLAKSNQFDAIICLGTVIRGETDHYEYVSNEAAKGIAKASRSTGIPVIFGVLTTTTVEQAINRAGEKQSNMGYTCGVNAIEMANLVHDIKML